MQHRYTADIGDFGKYGLIRFLLNKGKLRTGVLWFLTHPKEKDRRRNDGKHITYLLRNDNQFLQCNPILYQKLQKVHKINRHLSEIQRQRILPANTIYHEEAVDQHGLPPAYRGLYRQVYTLQAALKMQKADFVFCDPDNGLASLHKRPSDNGVNKSILLDELKLFWGLGKSLLIYNHRPRQNETILRKRYRQLKNHLGAKQIHVFRYRKGTQRDFLLIPQPKHWKFLQQRVRDFQNSVWVKQDLFETFKI